MWLSGKEFACQCRKLGFDSWIGRFPQRRECQHTPGVLPGKSHGQRSLVGQGPCGCKKSRTQLSDQATTRRSLTYIIMYMCSKSLQSCPTLCDPVDCSPPAPLSTGFPRQESQSGLPFPSPRDNVYHPIINVN